MICTLQLANLIVVKKVVDLLFLSLLSSDNLY